MGSCDLTRLDTRREEDVTTLEEVKGHLQASGGMRDKTVACFTWDSSLSSFMVAKWVCMCTDLAIARMETMWWATI
jgi:hypothetical protein